MNATFGGFRRSVVTGAVLLATLGLNLLPPAPAATPPLPPPLSHGRRGWRRLRFLQPPVRRFAGRPVPRPADRGRGRPSLNARGRSGPRGHDPGRPFAVPGPAPPAVTGGAAKTPN